MTKNFDLTSGVSGLSHVRHHALSMVLKHSLCSHSAIGAETSLQYTFKTKMKPVITIGNEK